MEFSGLYTLMDGSGTDTLRGVSSTDRFQGRNGLGTLRGHKGRGHKGDDLLICCACKASYVSHKTQGDRFMRDFASGLDRMESARVPPVLNSATSRRLEIPCSDPKKRTHDKKSPRRSARALMCGGPCRSERPMQLNHLVTVTLVITSGLPTTEPLAPVPSLMASTTSMPAVTSPTTVYWPFRKYPGLNMMKN